MQSLTHNALHLRICSCSTTNPNTLLWNPHLFIATSHFWFGKTFVQFWTNLLEFDANLRASVTHYNRVSGVPHTIDEVSNIDTRSNSLVSSINQTKIGLNQWDTNTCRLNDIYLFIMYLCIYFILIMSNQRAWCNTSCTMKTCTKRKFKKHSSFFTYEMHHMFVK